MATAATTKIKADVETQLQMGDAKLKFPSFPYKPYSIQIDFMNALYESLDRGGISMLESPTGTGKTLSIICSALQWLLDQKKKQKCGLGDNPKEDKTSGGSDDEPDWLRNFSVDMGDEGQNKLTENNKKKKKKHGFASVEPNSRKDMENGRVNEKGEGIRRMSASEKLAKMNNDEVKMDDEDFLLEDYESEEEGVRAKRKSHGLCDSSSSDDDVDKSDEDEVEERLKVYFCSRTHSQLSQFVKELKKTEFSEVLNMVCLGSRKNFCINDEVLKLGNTTRMNERCLDLQRNKKNGAPKIKSVGAGIVRRTNAHSGCPMLRKHRLQKEFRDEIYQPAALDIEDLVHLGRRIGTCPYYGSRSMVPAADLVVLPYQSLLSKASRESLGLTLKNNIIIIDEAHNLADSLTSMYDAKLTLSQLECVHSHIDGYFIRFQNLLGPGNRRYIQTLMVLTKAFLTVLQNKENHLSACEPGDVHGGDSALDCSMAINDFLFSLNIDNINLVKLVTYMNESNIIHKVCGYGEKLSSSRQGLELENSGGINEEESALSGFQALVGMLQSLTNSDFDGRIIVSRPRATCTGQQGGYLKFVMLTGEKIFSEIAGQAHAIILAGGTLQPIEETRERLFPTVTQEEFYFFSCSHIVPPESILPLAVSCGPTGVSFDFSFSSRSSSKVIKELGLLICNLVTVIPEGIVVFFSSFEYEGQVYSVWKELGILERIMKKKRIFREPRKNTDVEAVLREYKETIDLLPIGDSKDSTPYNGAVLLAVVGGKISEGINFSDGMGRCIIMVGLPYPSPSDIELIERVKHIEFQGEAISRRQQMSSNYFKGGVQAGFEILRRCSHRGKDYYENLCMKAVNQSIGRAIRHMNDYAAILLVDARYASDPSKRSSFHPTNRLPNWIKSRFSTAANYGEVHRQLYQFFKFNKNRFLLES